MQTVRENKAPSDWSIRISPEIDMDQWLPNLSETSGPHQHWSIECSYLSCFSLRNFWQFPARGSGNRAIHYFSILGR